MHSFNTCSPGSLKQFAVYKVVDMMVSSCHMEIRFRDLDGKEILDQSLQHDFTIMYNKNNHRKKKLLARLKLMKTWWESPEWLGSHHHPLRAEVWQTFSSALNYHPITPAYKFVLQVLFCKAAGGHKQGHHIKDKVYTFEKRLCTALSRFLEELGPFNLEELNTHLMIFENPVPLVTVVKHSPKLRVVHFFDQDMEPVMKQICKCSQNLEMLRANYVGECDKYLYKTFFNGMSKESVLKAFSNKDEIQMSFPALLHVHMWNRTPAPHLFLHVLLHVYTHLESITTLSFHELTPKHLTPLKKYFSSVERSPCDLKGIAFDSYSVFSLPDTVVNSMTVLYPKINHVTLNDKQQPITESSATIGRKIRNIVTKFGINSLAICSKRGKYIPVDLSIYRDTISIVGSKLTCLTLHGMNLDAEMLCELLDNCTQLQSLKISARVMMNETLPKLKPLPHLTTLEAWTYRLYDGDNMLLLVFNLVDAAPNIRNLQVNSRIVRNLDPGFGPDSRLQKLERLSLVGRPYCRQVGNNIMYDSTTRIRQFINALPSLHTLVLYLSDKYIELYKRYYRHKALKIVQGDKLLFRDTTQLFMFF
ncbi:unnamed protein product [Meganyctiphanes norvegica]|uniref:Uncharacterized protein n=1 Tax=Meganyctiphanes norvegica TaxID=48144 RepID=A0AAV2QNJ0_MEGNR